MNHFRLTPFRPKIVEKHVTEQCRHLLSIRGYWPARLHAGKFRTLDGARVITGVEKGTPDYAYLHGIYPGFLLELKAPGEGPSPEQRLKILELRQGWRLAVAVIDSGVALESWLNDHEKVAREKWRQLLPP